jgi:small subunit ribosomal protein S8e
MGREPAFTKIGELRVKEIRSRGGEKKLRLLSCDVANLFDPKTKHTARLR